MGEGHGSLRISSGICVETEPGGGFIAACILSLTENVVLPPGRNQVSRASYRLLGGDLYEAPAVIRFSDMLMRGPGAPPVGIAFTDQGKTTLPRVVSDGWIVGSSLRSSFHRADPDGDGRVTQEFHTLVDPGPVHVHGVTREQPHADGEPMADRAAWRICSQQDWWRVFG